MSLSPPIRRDSSPEQDSLASSERKRKRMQSNRESARRSRMKKQLHLDTLMAEAERLKADNADMEGRITLTTHQYLVVEKENQVLRARHAELADRLQSLNSILRFYEEFTGVSMDIPDMPVSQPFPIMKPWQVPLVDPIMTGAIPVPVPVPEPYFSVTPDPYFNPIFVPPLDLVQF